MWLRTEKSPVNSGGACVGGGEPTRATSGQTQRKATPFSAVLPHTLRSRERERSVTVLIGRAELSIHMQSANVSVAFSSAKERSFSSTLFSVPRARLPSTTSSARELAFSTQKKKQQIYEIYHCN